ncbi:hypothetical protein FisN_4Hh106 [Fistulifera solaris]|uniref:Solute carrier family 29 (Equilibrative nucleoside transporter), member 1/2/3 n=1 Tax=Fistulifera solaris TaxID=1519565 RepID=A0A1Z5KF53_FISSO|nr:hypothetical protein FisN_4Hh106 [Fistulifera solaris]|eukprot:GAX24588.1 hypothetical protein FisN_4Hh106 [Fistulifera solaris]
MSNDDNNHHEASTMLESSVAPTELIQQSSRLLLTQWVKTISLLRGVFCLLGIGVLVPWNAFISAKDYFQARFCMAHMESTFVVLFTLSSVVSMGVILLTQWLWEQTRRRRIPTEEPNDQRSHSNDEKASKFWFVQVPFVTYVLIFLAQAIMVTSISMKGITGWTLFSLIVSGAINVVASAGVVAAATTFTRPDWAMSPFLQGQSLGGVAVSLANFAAAISKNPDEYWKNSCSDNLDGEIDLDTRILSEAQSCGNYHSTDWGMFIYFLVAALVLAMCLIGYSMIDALRLEVESHSSTTSDFERESQRIGVELLPNVDDDDDDEGTSQDCSTRDERLDMSAHASYGAADGLLRDGVADIHESSVTMSASQVLWLVRDPTTCIFTTFVVTLALFPGWTSELTSIWRCNSHIRLVNDLYTPLTFLIFNIGDFMGRLMAGRYLEFLRHRLVTASFLRFAFIPLLLSCNSSYGGRFHIPSDLYSFLVQGAFSVSNGVLLTASFAHAPSLIASSNGNIESQTNQRMSEILTFTVALGLLGGSLLSFPVSNLLASG